MVFLGWTINSEFFFRKYFFKWTTQWLHLCGKKIFPCPVGIGPTVRQGPHSVTYWMQRSWIAWVISRHYFWLILLFYKWLCLVRVTFPVFLLSTKCMMVFFPSLLSNLVIFLLKKPFSIVIWHMGLLLDIICLMLSFWKLFCTLIVISMFL